MYAMKIKSPLVYLQHEQCKSNQELCLKNAIMPVLGLHSNPTTNFHYEYKSKL